MYGINYTEYIVVVRKTIKNRTKCRHRQIYMYFQNCKRLFPGPIRNSHCPLVIGSFIKDRLTSYFQGYMDNVSTVFELPIISECLYTCSFLYMYHTPCVYLSSSPLSTGFNKYIAVDDASTLKSEIATVHL